MLPTLLRAIALSASLAAPLLAALPASAEQSDFRVTLLGTGSPIPIVGRFSQSTLVQAGGHNLLFDFGRGASIRLTQAGVPIGSIEAHFITHMHSDHLNGLSDVWGTGWLPTAFGGRKTPMVIYGPQGTVEMTGHLTEAFAADIRIRTADELLPPEGIAFDAHDIEPGKVWEKDGVTVSAFEVNHGELIKPSFGYKIAYGGRTVVISGDTKYDERIVEQARGADLLIHEVANIDLGLTDKFPRVKEILNHHTTPEEAGQIFAQAKPKLAVYSHIVEFLPGKGLGDDVDADALVEKTRTTYEGPLVVGTDLMSFSLGDSVAIEDFAGR